MMKSAPLTRVIYWLDQQDAIQLYISTITIAEISYGINALPHGNRRIFLEDAFNKVLEKVLHIAYFRLTMLQLIFMETLWAEEKKWENP